VRGRSPPPGAPAELEETTHRDYAPRATQRGGGELPRNSRRCGRRPARHLGAQGADPVLPRARRLPAPRTCLCGAARRPAPRDRLLFSRPTCSTSTDQTTAIWLRLARHGPPTDYSPPSNPTKLPTTTRPWKSSVGPTLPHAEGQQNGVPTPSTTTRPLTAGSHRRAPTARQLHAFRSDQRRT